TGRGEPQSKEPLHHPTACVERTDTMRRQRDELRHHACRVQVSIRHQPRVNVHPQDHRWSPGTTEQRAMRRRRMSSIASPIPWTSTHPAGRDVASLWTTSRSSAARIPIAPDAADAPPTPSPSPGTGAGELLGLKEPWDYVWLGPEVAWPGERPASSPCARRSDDTDASGSGSRS